MNYGILSIIPPILTIAIAFKTKKAELAMLIGIFTGCIILCTWNPFTAVSLTVESILDSVTDKGNLKILLFTSLMGAFVGMMKLSGGVDGFVNYLIVQNKKMKSKTAAMLLAYVIGVIMFVDGLMGIMFKGVVMLPIFDKFKISREKLAYISNATSAPVCAIIVLNSWGAFIMGLISTQITAGNIQGDPTSLLLQSLPLQFYSVVILLFTLFVILIGKDWGLMKKAEDRVINTGKLYDDGVVPLMDTGSESETVVEKGKENKNNMIIPLILLIGCTFAGLLITGKGNLIKGDGTTSILYAVVISLAFMCFYFARQKIMTAKEYGKHLSRGIFGMASLIVLLVLSFTIGETISSLGTGPYLASLAGNVSGIFTAAIVFILGALMSFATGTSWGTFSIMMPIGISMAVAMDANIVLTIGAVISGGVFGDQASPISDRTILSAMTSGTDLLSHTKTQLPYAIFCAIVATALYIVMGVVL